MDKIIITIAREHGSGGRLVGKLLSEKLGIPFYDKELLAITAKESGLSEDFINEMEDKQPKSFLYDLYMSASPESVYDHAFIVQSNIIKQIAEDKSCIFVGRCADYVLRYDKNCIKVFIHAPIEDRIDRVVNVYHEAELKNAEKQVKKCDKRRAAYYNFNTQSQWGKAQNYDLCINSKVGIEKTADIIVDYIKENEKK